jgi:hypothetical protein
MWYINVLFSFLVALLFSVCARLQLSGIAASIDGINTNTQSFV